VVTADRKTEGRLPGQVQRPPAAPGGSIAPSAGDGEARRRARVRLRHLDAYLRVCAELHELAPLTVYYSTAWRDRWAS
jgi:hypothetical protein